MLTAIQALDDEDLELELFGYLLDGNAFDVAELVTRASGLRFAEPGWKHAFWRVFLCLRRLQGKGLVEVRLGRVRRDPSWRTGS